MFTQTAQTPRRIELPDSQFIFGNTVGMREVQRKIEGALEDDAPVLIKGESGTGKEVIGRFLHQRSKRQDGPFIKLNCAALPLRLLEEGIFGCQQDKSVDASSTGDLNGEAARGTLFLDEIGDLDLTMQGRLTQELETGRRVGVAGKGYQPSSARRFVCSTSIDLEAASRNQTFLRELLACFAPHRVVLPPLRERKEDIPQLCDYLIEKFARDFGRQVPKLSSSVLAAFQQWRWPGNIRELENWIARIVIFGTEEAIGLEFRRQLVASGAEPARRHHAIRMKVDRGRRLRGHR